MCLFICQEVPFCFWLSVQCIILVQVWDKVLGVSITGAANEEIYSPEQLAKQITAMSSTVNRIGFIGLGAMGFGMATHLLSSNFCVLGYDVISYVQFLLHSTWKIKLLLWNGMLEWLVIVLLSMLMPNFLHLWSFLLYMLKMYLTNAVSDVMV